MVSLHPLLALRTKKVNIKESFADIVKNETSLFLLEDKDVLNEFQLFDKIKKSTKSISSKVAKAATKILQNILKRIDEAFKSIKNLGDRIIHGIMWFFGIEVNKIKIKSGGNYPLT